MHEMTEHTPYCLPSVAVTSKKKQSSAGDGSLLRVAHEPAAPPECRTLPDLPAPGPTGRHNQTSAISPINTLPSIHFHLADTFYWSGDE